MNTVLYFEITRKKENLLKYIVGPVVLSVILFAACMVVDYFFPEFNQTYMKWPDMLKDLLCLKSWTSHLWLNIWQFFTLVYPFYLIYVIVRGLSEAVSEEERLETLVYLHNAGVDRKTVLIAKGLVWFMETVLCCLSLLLVHVIFAAVLGSTQGIFNTLQYYGTLLLISILYLSIALFAAACKGKKGVSKDMIAAILLLPLLISRLPACLRFFASLLEMTGREGSIVDRIAWLGERSEILTVVSPLTWCWPALTVSLGDIICGVLIFVIMLVSAFSIYTHKRKV